MNFTREPIIETIISPKDGFKLLVRSSKGGNSEEYYVDALEVVSFGKAFFFRSTERPKAFLVPTSDYEVLEVKETRVALKNVSHERSIKIGGGREAPVRQREKEPYVPKPEEPAASEESTEQEPETTEVASSEHRRERGRDRRRRRHRRQGEEQEWTDRRPAEQQQRDTETPKADTAGEGGGAQDETKVLSSMFSGLFPPPPKLISETLSRYQDKEFFEGPPASRQAQKEKEESSALEEKQEEPSVAEEKQEEVSKEKDPARDEDSGSEPSSLSRVHTSDETAPFTSTHFSPLHGTGFNPFF